MEIYDKVLDREEIIQTDVTPDNMVEIVLCEIEPDIDIEEFEEGDE